MSTKKDDVETCRACSHEHKRKSNTWEIVLMMHKGERYPVTRCVYAFNARCAEILKDRASA